MSDIILGDCQLLAPGRELGEQPPGTALAPEERFPLNHGPARGRVPDGERSPASPSSPCPSAPSVQDAGGYDLARRSVGAELSSGRFGLFRVIAVPTGPALQAIGAKAVLRGPSRVRPCRVLRAPLVGATKPEIADLR